MHTTDIPVNSSSSTTSSEEQLRRFREEGYFIVRGVFTPEVLDGARREIEALVEIEARKLQAAGRVGDTLSDEPFETRLVKLFAGNLDLAPTQFRVELHRPGFFDIFFNPRILDFVEKIVGSEIQLYPNYTVRPKLPEWEEARVPWHQDGGLTAAFYGDDLEESVTRLAMANVWAPLVPATVENGCMQFIPGTHRLGVVPHEKKDHIDGEIVDSHLTPHLDKAIAIELDPGDAVVFHNLLFHQGLPNKSKGVRWSMDWRYLNAGQDTLRKEKGHLARSAVNPRAAVRDAQHWASLEFQ